MCDTASGRLGLARRLAGAIVAALAVLALAGCGSGAGHDQTEGHVSGRLHVLAHRGGRIAVAWARIAAATGVSVASPDRWPLIQHQGGAFAVRFGETAAFERTGLTLDITNQISDPGDGRVRYLDARAGNLEERYFGRYRCNFTPTPCPVAHADEQAFLAAFQKELTKQHGNRSVVGWYILDDYPGNISRILQKVHAMVAADNATEPNPRATVCGFGGSLDYHDRHAPAGTYEKEFASLSHFARLELQNFSPRACDLVDLYVYSLSHRAPTSDYSMAWTLPAMIAGLREHGWNPATTPLIGSPQAWEGTPPTAAQIAAQTTAFCAYGAQSIIAFAWHNFPSSGPLAEPELADSADMRRGLVTGVQACRRIWARQAKTGPRTGARVALLG